MIIDVSKYQGDINWSKVKNEVEGVIIRSYVGNSGVDKMFTKNIEGAIAQGIKVGVYCYSKAKSESAGRTEAKKTIEAIAPYKDKIYYPVFIDVEQDGTGEYSKTVCKAFIDEVKANGYKAGVYCSEGWRSSYLKGFSTDYWWIAKWGSKQPSNCCIWQYSSKGKVSGISGDVDLDKNISYEPSPAPTPKPSGGTVNVELNVLKRGSTGGQVGTLQRLLKELGYKDQYGKVLAIDDNFGGKTEYAVNQYQKRYPECGSNGKPDGMCGQKMWNHILKSH